LAVSSFPTSAKKVAGMVSTERPPQPLVVSLAALTVVSGIVDAVSFLALGHVFTANMTGNVALIGFGIAGAPAFSVAASACALGLFLVGAVVGGRISLRLPSERSLLVAVIAIELALTIAAAVIARAHDTVGIGSGWPRYALISLLALGMGSRNAAVRKIGVPDMSTTVLTTTLTGFASESFLAGGRNPNAANRTTSVLCMFGGALVGAVLVQHLHAGWALVIACVILFLTALYFYREAPVELGTT
jgi:uncharacterized membrane protein YoaK (UPF0700 family)